MEPAEELFKRLIAQGEPSVDEFIAARHSESQFVDFKRSRANKQNPKLMSDDDRNNLADAIAGFANSNGGVVVWGVECNDKIDGADVAKCKHPIPNVKRFKSWLESATSRCTDPTHSGVEHAVISENADGTGYVATLVRSSSLAPFQTIPDMRFLVRAGSSFVPVSRAVLAGMFGRRPQPEIRLGFHPLELNLNGKEALQLEKTAEGDHDQKLHLRLLLLVQNIGNVVAADVFVNCRVSKSGNMTYPIFFNTYDHAHAWDFNGVYTHEHCAMSKPGVRLGPDARVSVMELIFDLGPEEKLTALEFSWGAGGAPPDRGFLVFPGTWVSDVLGEIKADQAAKQFPDNGEERGRKYLEGALKLFRSVADLPYGGTPPAE